MARSGQFITIEGGEGCGKSTQIRLLLQAFENARLAAIHTREPGGTVGAEAIRALLVQGDPGRWDNISETLLFCAARREHMVKTVWPALEKGTHIICDRFFDSTRVYQGFGKGLGDAFVKSLHHLTLGDCKPDLTFWLDLDAEAGLKRAHARHGDIETRFEAMPENFHERVRYGFDSIAHLEPERVVRINAAQEIAAVHRDMLAALRQRLGLVLSPVAAGA